MPITAVKDNCWVLETRNTAYALGIDDKLRTPLNWYWGPKLPRRKDYRPPAPRWWHLNGTPDGLPEEYPAWGGLRFLECCLKAEFHEGTRDVILAFAGADIAGEELQIRLKDEVFPLIVTLHYRVRPDQDIIERWATFKNESDDPILIDRAFSAQWAVPDRLPCRLTHLDGQWADECHPTRDWLTQGARVIESRRITSGSHHFPFFALDRGDATEHAGQVWFGALAWSGNWKLIAEVTDGARTRASIGLNDFDFRWKLTPGETFTTPVAYGGYTSAGFGAAIRCLHDLVRDHVLPTKHLTRKVLYNSWEITTFHVNEAQQIELAKTAADMGVELFVVDDGWFHNRENTKGGLGDWWPDETKFPHGLQPLIKAVNDLGMDFGLWVEPEMVSFTSDLYRQHPDWILHYPNRPLKDNSADPLPRREKDQLILNLARTDVQDYLIALLDKLLTENNIRFIKWDMNRHPNEAGWPQAAELGRDPKEVWTRYVLGLYRIWETLRAKHPQVVFQSCQSGGGRADLGMLHVADQVWASDNSEPLSRLKIQDGFSHAIPACVIEAWVTEQNAKLLPLDFRFHVSMSGVLGVGGATSKWSSEQRDQAKKLIIQYKQLRHVIHEGDLYRLRSPSESPFSAHLYVAKDKSEAVLFAFYTQLSWPFPFPQLPLMGLDPDSLYEVEGEPAPRSGAAWQHDGLQLTFKNEISSTMKHIRKV